MAPYATPSDVQAAIDELERRLRPLITQLQGSAISDDDARIGPYAALGTSFTTTNGAVVIAPTDGTFWLFFGGSGSGSTAGAYQYLAPAVNGVTQGINAYQQLLTNGSFVSMAAGMSLVLRKGDVVSLFGRTSAGTFTPDYTWARLEGRGP